MEDLLSVAQTSMLICRHHAQPLATIAEWSGKQERAPLPPRDLCVSSGSMSYLVCSILFWIQTTTHCQLRVTQWAGVAAPELGLSALTPAEGLYRVRSVMHPLFFSPSKLKFISKMGSCSGLSWGERQTQGQATQADPLQMISLPPQSHTGSHIVYKEKVQRHFN